jgi:hypothetical protein
MRRAARRRVAIEASKVAGCTCNLKVVGSHKDKFGFNHVVVAHDGWCRLADAPSLIALYSEHRCER